MAEFKELGVALKAYRVAADETIEDVSNALELDKETILLIESGELQPMPEMIELIARHFALREQEAERLLELAGYGKDEFALDLESDVSFEELTRMTDVIVGPILYTDTVKVVSNKFGVIINFVQSNGGDGKSIVVSRVGMSHQHAKSVIEVLQRSLGGGQPRQASQEPSTDETPEI